MRLLLVETTPTGFRPLIRTSNLVVFLLSKIQIEFWDLRILIISSFLEFVSKDTSSYNGADGSEGGNISPAYSDSKKSELSFLI